MEDMKMLLNNNEYLDLVQLVKQEIRQAQYKATLNVNRELILLYYGIGRHINAHKSWGNKFIENLAADIKISFPDAKGYSVRNLKYMAKFAASYEDEEFVQTVSAQIPWSHNIAILDKVKTPEEREWYIRKTAENGWSHSVLIHQIESGLYQRQVLADKVSNFENRLPAPQSELATQTMKDPYIFDFIPFKEDMVERDIEQALVKDITKLLLELGTGFAFLGNQYHLSVGGDDFYIDLLFYNLNLRCYVVIELKTGEFKPDYAGQLNFYLSAVDGILKSDKDNPTIGLLLCKSKNDVVAEYALKDMSKPMGVSEYKVTSELPEDLGKQLPSVEDIQKHISNERN
jgi:predicted nuclease of restriction endonuclease-like (RecB) superfamily